MQSSYCQQWQMTLMIEEIGRRSVFGTGKIIDLITVPWDYFHCLRRDLRIWFGSSDCWVEFLLLFETPLLHAGANIGDRVCLYPNGADPMMTEPELVTIGNLMTLRCALNVYAPCWFVGNGACIDSA